jgi:4-amino-4-deoxy-L-arabinose transferase-like glycosyltransferase
VPAWIIYAFARVFPATIPLTYALGALQVGMMLGAAWLLGRDLLGSRKACIGILLITCINYYTNRVHFFNHNTALLVTTAWCMYCLWRALQSDRQAWWLALGACWGIGLLSKYQMALPIACNIAYVFTARPVNRLQVRGLIVASAMTAMCLLPHIVWLFANDFPTFHYASRFLGAALSFGGRLLRMASFTGDQMLRMIALFVMLPLFNRIYRSHAWPATTPAPHDDRTAAIRRFLAIHAWGPLIIMELMALLLGVDLQMHWGTAFLWTLPLWFMTTSWGDRLEAIGPRTVLTGIASAQILLAVVFAMTR